MGGKQSAIPKKELQHRFGLTNQQYDDLKAIFREHSKGRNELTRQEFRKVYSGRFPGNATKFADKMFDCFDTDGNDTVDFVEFVIGICMTDSDTIENKINIAFSLFDSDRSGYLDRVEIQDLLRAYNELVGTSATEINPNVVANQLFDAMDLDKDDAISKAEFTEAVQKIPALLNLIRPDPGD